jgi:phosphohistidine phosphatase SixA
LHDRLPGGLRILAATFPGQGGPDCLRAKSCYKTFLGCSRVFAGGDGMDSGTILVMRHAEKPEDPLDPDLAPAGHKRAEKLADYIPQTFGRPDFIFVSAISKHSHRPCETVKPLSKLCGVPVDAEFADQDYPALAHEILTAPRFEGKQVLICWHHGNIPSLAHALGAKHGDYPDPWPRDVFNLILKLSYRVGKPQLRPVTEPF